MPGRGLEPPRDLTPTTTSTWRVCQFRHPGLGAIGQYSVVRDTVESINCGVALACKGFKSMRVIGLEPTRVLPHQNLNLARLPISPHPRRTTIVAN